MTQPSRMRSMRARASGEVLLPSNASQSPIQKSNCRYSLEAHGGVGASDCGESTAVDVRPADFAKRRQRQSTPTLENCIVSFSPASLLFFICREFVCFPNQCISAQPFTENM